MFYILLVYNFDELEQKDFRCAALLASNLYYFLICLNFWSIIMKLIVTKI